MFTCVGGLDCGSTSGCGAERSRRSGVFIGLGLLSRRPWREGFSALGAQGSRQRDALARASLLATCTKVHAPTSQVWCIPRVRV